MFSSDSRFDERVSRLKNSLRISKRRFFFLFFFCQYVSWTERKSKIKIDNAICARDATNAHVNIENDVMVGDDVTVFSLEKQLPEKQTLQRFFFAYALRQKVLSINIAYCVLRGSHILFPCEIANFWGFGSSRLANRINIVIYLAFLEKLFCERFAID